jgi:hypothetical protein
LRAGFFLRPQASLAGRLRAVWGVSLPSKIILPPPEVCAHTAEQFAGQENDEHYATVWDAALRLIEDGTPDYRS